MGIKNLWETLECHHKKVPMYTLDYQTVAIDLAGWVVEGQTAQANTKKGAKPPPQPSLGSQLTAVFYRTVDLLNRNVRPVFVLEGQIPILKLNLMAKKYNKLNNISAGVRKSNDAKLRKRFNHVLKECEKMLGLMGLTCITAKGEAEATCAYLNSKNLVDAVITNDSDCIAYGAKKVYRKFSMTDKSFEVYDMEIILKDKDFGRNKAIAFALLCGCDYDEGVDGVGPTNTLEFLSNFKDDEVLDRIRSWKNEYVFKEYMKKLHDETVPELERKRLKIESDIRKRALKNPNFPSEAVIKEFLNVKETIEEVDLVWHQPKLTALMGFTSATFNWKEKVTLTKTLPLLTYWQLKNHEYVAEKIASNKLSDLKGVVFPKVIKNRRFPNGVPKYSILWDDTHNFFKHFVPDDQIRDADEADEMWTTLEVGTFVEQAYPNLINQFEEETSKKKAKKRKEPTEKRNDKDKKPRQKEDDEAENDPAPKYFPVFQQALKGKKKPVADYSFDINASGLSEGADVDLDEVVDRVTSRPLELN